MNTLSILLLVIGFLIIGITSFLAIKQFNERIKLQKKYSPLIDIDAEINCRKDEIDRIQTSLENLNEEYLSNKNKLGIEYKSLKEIYDRLKNEIAILEESTELMSYGVYKPHFEFGASEDYKNQIIRIQEFQKLLIKEERAIYCGTNWEVQGSVTKGKQFIKQNSKLLLRAFNGECDAAILKVRWNNVQNMEERVQKSFEAINRLGTTANMSITTDYLKNRLDELYLAFEYQQKLYQEKEEQRRNREQIREEEKRLKDIEKAQKEAENEELKYQKAIEKAKLEIEKAAGEEIESLNQKIIELETSLKSAQEKKERAISQAQLTKSGHVYIISNIGSFGENIFKIGMTRRLEPMDRIDELGDASVPFDFDVHALIYSENAPELESLLHSHFEKEKVNKVNNRREFFNVSLEDIEAIIKEHNLNFELIKTPEAKEFRESIAISEQIKEKMKSEAVTSDFPDSLF